MKDIDIRDSVQVISGKWTVASDQIDVSHVQKRDIYRSSLEPSFVCWAILWKESDGTLKLSFTEATGDQSAWPPTYNFNSGDIEYYLKTLVSRDGGKTWADTGWREDQDPLYDMNSDHCIRHVFQVQDGTLLRNYGHTLEGVTSFADTLTYDKSKAMQHFPFSNMGTTLRHLKFTSTWKSINGGSSWKKIHINREEVPFFFVTGIHQLRNGSIVATGGILDSYLTEDTCKVGITESRDGGNTWSTPQIIAENDDRLAPQLVGQENDFVELPDGRLLLVQRTCGTGINTLQAYMSRDDSGKWHRSKWSTNPQFPQSGYPYLHRAGDGTIFYYCHYAIRYTCDDGITWYSLPLGMSYYGQLAEARPGHIVAVSQKNIGDCSYPFKHDTAMAQTSFDFRRIGVVEQTDADALTAVAALGKADYSDLHLYAQVRADGETGLAFAVSGDSYWFAALVIPCNEFRAPGRATRAEQDAVLVIGRCESGTVTESRRLYAGKIMPGSWVEMQIDKSGDILKAAVKLSEREDYFYLVLPATYAVVRGTFGRGKPGLFTNRSTGAFKNVRIGPAGVEIRSNWQTSGEESMRIALDAGRQE